MNEQDRNIPAENLYYSLAWDLVGRIKQEVYQDQSCLYRTEDTNLLAIRDFAQTRALLGDTYGAREAISFLQTLFPKTDFIKLHTAEVQADAGLLDDALATARTIPFMDARVSAIGYIGQRMDPNSSQRLHLFDESEAIVKGRLKPNQARNPNLRSLVEMALQKVNLGQSPNDLIADIEKLGSEVKGDMVSLRERMAFVRGLYFLRTGRINLAMAMGFDLKEGRDQIHLLTDVAAEYKKRGKDPFIVFNTLLSLHIEDMFPSSTRDILEGIAELGYSLKALEIMDQLQISHQDWMFWRMYRGNDLRTAIIRNLLRSSDSQERTIGKEHLQRFEDEILSEKSPHYAIQTDVASMKAGAGLLTEAAQEAEDILDGENFDRSKRHYIDTLIYIANLAAKRQFGS